MSKQQNYYVNTPELHDLRQQTYDRIVRLLRDESTWSCPPTLGYRSFKDSEDTIWRSRPQLLLGVSCSLAEAQEKEQQVADVLEDANHAPAMLRALDAFGADRIAPVQYRVKVLEAAQPEVELRVRPAYSQQTISADRYRFYLGDPKLGEFPALDYLYHQAVEFGNRAEEKRLEAALRANDEAFWSISNDMDYVVMCKTGNALRVGYIGLGEDGRTHWQQTNIGNACIVVCEGAQAVSFYTRRPRSGRQRRPRLYQIRYRWDPLHKDVSDTDIQVLRAVPKSS